MSGIGELAARLHYLLARRGATLGAAESLTGGLLSAELTAIPGASVTFLGAVVSYSTAVKAEVLGVDAGLLAAQGAVHPAVAAAMAEGARRVLRADWGVSVTGVAGPQPQDGRPVGTVFAAVHGPAGQMRSERLRLRGDRTEIRCQTAAAALALVTVALTDDDRN